MLQALAPVALKALALFLKALLAAAADLSLPGAEKAARVRAEAKAALASGTVAANKTFGWAVGLAIEYAVARSEIAAGALDRA